MNKEDDLNEGTNSPGDDLYVLRLFITGTSAVSVRAINNLQRILNQYVKDKYELEIIDVHQQPSLVKEEDVTAVPMLIKKYPFPKKRLVGDMSDVNRVLKGLGIEQ